MTEVDTVALNDRFLTVDSPQSDVLKSKSQKSLFESILRNEPAPMNVEVADLSKNDAIIADNIDNFSLHFVKTHNHQCQLDIDQHLFYLI